MARTKIRETQVQDSDFASEVELEDRLDLHNTNKLHPPLATPGTDDGLYLRFDGTNYIWSEAVPGDGQDGLPDQTNNEDNFLTTDGVDASWINIGAGKLVDAGWKDNTSPLMANTMGSKNTSPLWAGTNNGFWGWHFSGTKSNELYSDFHVDHDYERGSLIYPHVHWMPMSYSRGDVVWEMEYVYARGHNQNESLTEASSSFQMIGTGKGLIGEHMVTEANDNQGFSVSEEDTIIRIIIRRLGDNASDTFHGTVAGLYVDLHYHSNRENSIGRLPDFDVETGAVL